MSARSRRASFKKASTMGAVIGQAAAKQKAEDGKDKSQPADRKVKASFLRKAMSHARTALFEDEDGADDAGQKEASSGWKRASAIVKGTSRTLDRRDTMVKLITQTAEKAYHQRQAQEQIESDMQALITESADVELPDHIRDKILAALQNLRKLKFTDFTSISECITDAVLDNQYGAKALNVLRDAMLVHLQELGNDCETELCMSLADIQRCMDGIIRDIESVRAFVREAAGAEGPVEAPIARPKFHRKASLQLSSVAFEPDAVQDASVQDATEAPDFNAGAKQLEAQVPAPKPPETPPQKPSPSEVDVLVPPRDDQPASPASPSIPVSPSGPALNHSGSSHSLPPSRENSGFQGSQLASLEPEPRSKSHEPSASARKARLSVAEKVDHAASKQVGGAANSEVSGAGAHAASTSAEEGSSRRASRKVGTRASVSWQPVAPLPQGPLPLVWEAPIVPRVSSMQISHVTTVGSNSKRFKAQQQRQSIRGNRQFPALHVDTNMSDLGLRPERQPRTRSQGLTLLPTLGSGPSQSSDFSESERSSDDEASIDSPTSPSSNLIAPPKSETWRSIDMSLPRSNIPAIASPRYIQASPRYGNILPTGDGRTGSVVDRVRTWSGVGELSVAKRLSAIPS